jgi:hypothetical protein
MRFVCACTGNEPVGDYSFAVITIPDSYHDWLLARMAVSKKLKAEEPEMYAVEYFDHQVEYYRCLDPLAPEEEPEAGDFVRVFDNFEPEISPLRTTAATVCVTDDSIVWKGHPKHGGGEFETATMTEEFLRSLVASLAEHAD